MGMGYGATLEPIDGVNTSNNLDFQSIDAGKRQLIKGTAAAVAALVGSQALSGCTVLGSAHQASSSAPALGFTSVPVSIADNLVVPPEYQAQVLYRWGDAIGSQLGAPAFKIDGSNTWQEQELQAGMHHDGMEFFPLPNGAGQENRGLLAINHEYTDDGLLHADGMKTWTSDKVRKSQAATGVSVVEVAQQGAQWRVVANSKYARRITVQTPMLLSGPAAGHDLLKTAADATGTRSLGTANNCAAGQTPWGTYLTCEENWNGYFSSQETPSADEKRYGLTSKGFGYRWHEHDARFDAAKNPNEPHRFGWVVEIDPMDATQTPVKRTALGRFKHEGATSALTKDGRAVVYMGDDERFEYIYKFVSRDKVRQGGYQANKNILDYGTLYVARFNSAGIGAWLPLVHGTEGLTAANGFASQAEVLIKCRQAADVLGATKMDRPEWITVNPLNGEVFVTLTNNTQRGQAGRAESDMVDSANPRNDNVMGHIIRWREGSASGAAEGDAAALEFRWMHFALAGDPNSAKSEHKGNIKGDMYGSPDGLKIDAGGLMWIQTDISTSVMNKGVYAPIGNNMMLCADPKTGQTKRFLTGPSGCEITGITFTADRRSVFINIQHPGETPSERSDSDKPLAVSAWPDGTTGGRPRSATVVIRRKDGGIVGT